MLVRFIPPLALLLMTNAGHLYGAGTVLRIDTINPGDLTLVLKDFNSATPQHTSISANTGSPGITTWVAPSDPNQGYHSYVVPNDTEDGKVSYSTVPYDTNYYTTMRIRMSASNSGGSSDFWPNNPHGQTTINFTGIPTTFTEYNRFWTNPDHSNVLHPNNGFRWDPDTKSIEMTYNIDYVMVDRGRVVGFEFDINESGLSTYQSFSNSGNRISDLRVENSILKGTTTSNDDYLQNTSISSLSLSTSIYQYAEIRLKTESNVRLQFFWKTSASDIFSENKSVGYTTVDDGWHTYLIDFTSEVDFWTGTLTGFRVDVGNGVGNTGVSGIDFEIDYIRFREIGVVPEPARALLVLAGLSFLGLRRRR